MATNNSSPSASRPRGGRRPQFLARECLVRLRLTKACNARMLLLARADGLPLAVVARDGHLLEAPQLLDEVLLTPAQAASVPPRLVAQNRIGVKRAKVKAWRQSMSR